MEINWLHLLLLIPIGVITHLIIKTIEKKGGLVSFVNKTARSVRRKFKVLAIPRGAIIISAQYEFNIGNWPYCIVIEDPFKQLPDAKEEDEHEIFYDDGEKVVRDGCDKWRCISKPGDARQFFILAYLSSFFTNEEIINVDYRREHRDVGAKKIVEVAKQGTLVAIERNKWERVKDRKKLNVFTNQQGTITGMPVQEGVEGDSVLIRLGRV